MIPLLIDNDVFCKLAIWGLLEDALDIFHVKIKDCGCLPALRFMLRRGRLRHTFGEAICNQLVPLAGQLIPIGPSDPTLLDRLTSIPSIDPGEAQLFATAAKNSSFVLTGDKRALHALKNITPFTEVLSERIVVLEAILLALNNQLGNGAIKSKVGSSKDIDKAISICFSNGNPDPKAGLESYFQALTHEVDPLKLWCVKCNKEEG